MDKLKKLAKWLGAGFGVLVVLVIGLVVAASCSWSTRLDARYETPDHEFEIPELTDENRAEAERLYLARGCGDCHGEDGGGRDFVDAPPFLMNPPNITGVVRAMSANDLHKLVRRGVRPDGSPLFFMPAHEYQRMPDRELGLIVAHIRSLPQLDTTHEASELRIPGRVLAILGVLDTPLLPAEIIDLDAPYDPAEGDDFGEYLAQGCRGCHGQTFSGGPIPGAPPELGVPRNLTPHETGLGGWTQEQFTTAMRTGRTPSGDQLDGEQMPYRVYQHMTDEELSALFAYLQTLEPLEEGNR